MNRSFFTIIRQALRKKGYVSLRAFYQRHSFSFSYEYLRQILAQEKVPTPQVVAELAEKLGLNAVDLQKAAVEARLAQKIRLYYQVPSATRPGRLSEKIGRYRVEGLKEAKILRLLEKLGEKEKDQLLNYLKFLHQQCRRRDKEKGP